MSPIAEEPSVPALRNWRAPVWRWTVAATLVAAVSGVWFDRWNTQRLIGEARNSVAGAMAPTASSLRTAVERRVALLAGLKSFADAEPSRARLDADFPTFAQGIVVSADGVRALQFVDDGRIVSTWPLENNERALGYDLLADARPVVPRDVRRAMASDSTIVTGPIALVQGGDGLLVRRRLVARAGFPDLAAIILDVDPIIAEVGIPDARTGLRMEVRDRTGAWFGGDPAGSAMAPESLVVRVPDGNWTLLGAPVNGWAAAIAPARNSARAAMLFLGLFLVGLFTFIGDRQTRMVGALATRTARLGVALKAGRMGAWELDAVNDRMTFDASASAILGRAPGEVDGPMEQMFSVLHPQDATFVARVFLEILGSDRHEYTLEHRILLPDGNERWVLVNGDIERDASGKAVRVHGIISDASDRRAMEARARQLERVETIGTMAGGVAHDFNNLLTAMVSFTELARDALANVGPEAQVAPIREDLDEALKVAMRARGLTAQLLAFSRGAAAEPRRTEISRMLGEMEPLLRRLLGRRIQLTLQLGTKASDVWIDPSQFTQVVLNLVVNARDAIAENGDVRIELRELAADDRRPSGAPAGAWVLVQVTDSGVGMSEEVRRRVFEPYFTTKKSARGTGLGLSVVHGVVRASGGHAWVESQPGRGTTFSVFLPPLSTNAQRDIPAGA
jgi:PAS domain S-box-containing protein